MTGLRERKKEQTRRRIAAVARRLFAERGFDAVTVNEIADAAEIAKATLFSYFPTKESLALEGVADDDLAAVVAGRPRGQAPLQALRTHFRTLAAGRPEDADWAELTAQARVIAASPALTGAADRLLYQQRQSLARELAGEFGPRTAALMAAQITASQLTLQESFFQRLMDGVPGGEALRALAEDVEVAFDLLQHGHDGKHYHGHNRDSQHHDHDHDHDKER
ncbi:TetR family transcriptional regulator [Streptomyces sp. TS71-3]|uniref:TetR family transcriptional regulator n=1 Tax=Streptomyces sp. TS71-3 TaxID=2733862 RepID=UPI001BB39FAD|nr:TetR family transcriptional regulator [Streptomyces sp. TS71-3]